MFSILLGTFFLICLGGCEKLPKAPAPNIKQKDELPEGFMAFYNRFHADSSFQMASIMFPLDGKPADTPSDLYSRSFSWEASEWKIQKPFQADSDDYIQQFTSLNERFVTETIRLKQLQYGIERRFAKVNGKWFLVYYADINELK